LIAKAYETDQEIEKRRSSAATSLIVMKLRFTRVPPGVRPGASPAFYRDMCGARMPLETGEPLSR
jgi:hypothetical protein